MSFGISCDSSGFFSEHTAVLKQTSHKCVEVFGEGLGKDIGVTLAGRSGMIEMSFT